MTHNKLPSFSNFENRYIYIFYTLNVALALEDLYEDNVHVTTYTKGCIKFSYLSRNVVWCAPHTVWMNCTVLAVLINAKWFNAKVMRQLPLGMNSIYCVDLFFQNIKYCELNSKT